MSAMRRWYAAIVSIACLIPAAATSSSIGVYLDPGGFLCPTIPIFQPATVYVVALLAPDACVGITGAEFRLDGFPTQAEGWLSAPQYPPSVQADGDPFGDGVLLSFPSCQVSTSGAVVLFSITAFATNARQDLPVTAAVHRAPSDPSITCPVLRLCGSATPVCAAAAPTQLNPSWAFCPCQAPCYDACPPLAVRLDTWSQVKRLCD